MAIHGFDRELMDSCVVNLGRQSDCDDISDVAGRFTKILTAKRPRRQVVFLLSGMVKANCDLKARSLFTRLYLGQDD